MEVHRMIPPSRARTLPIWWVFLSIGLGACGEDRTAPVEPAEPDTVVSSIGVSSQIPGGVMITSDRTIGILGTQVPVSAVALTEDGERLYGSVGHPGRFSWSSSAPDVATVEAAPHPRIAGRKQRLVAGVSEGTATITATSQGVTGSMPVTVRDRAELTWSVAVGMGFIDAGVAVGGNGTTYIGINEWGAPRSRLFAVLPEGAVLWSVELPGHVRSIPAIGDDGTLYIGSQAGHLFAVDPGGSIQWMLEGLDPIRSSPAIGPDGTIYVAGGHHVYAVDPQGAIQWAYERERDETVFFMSSPAIATDGTIYLGGEDGLLFAFDPDGSLRWTFRTGDRIRSSPSIGVDGTIYFGSHDGRLYAVSPDGTERWSVHLDERGIVSSPSIGPDGTIYVLANGVVAIDPSGSSRWNYGSGGRSSATPILGVDGTVYVGFAGGVTAALDAQGSLLWDYRAGRHISGSPAIGVDGTVVSTRWSPPEPYEGTVYGVTETEPVNGGFEGAPWPTERGDRANTGRAGG